MKIFKIILVVFFPLVVSAQITPGNIPVLVAYANTTGNTTSFSFHDSGRLVYSPGKGYDSLTNRYLFDTLYGFNYNSILGYVYSWRELRLLNTKKNILSTLISSVNSTGLLTDSIKYTYSYDADNYMLGSTKQTLNKITGTWQNIEKYIYVYDSRHNRTIQIYQNWDNTGGRWQDANRHYYSYDPSNNLIGDVYQTWSTLYSTFITQTSISNEYNGYNQIVAIIGRQWDNVASAWIDLYRYQYDYDISTHDLIKKIHELPPGPAWTMDSFTYYTFDTDHNMIEEHNSTIDNVYTYDSSHNILSITYNVFGIYGHDRQVFYSYNEYNEVTVYTAQRLNDTTLSWENLAQNRYYYDFTPPLPTRLNTIAVADGSLKLYPIPANSIINVDLRWRKEKPAFAAVYDETGRLWLQWQIEPSLFSHSSIPVNQLPVGNYIIRIKGENEILTEKFNVIY